MSGVAYHQECLVQQLLSFVFLFESRLSQFWYFFRSITNIWLDIFPCNFGTGYVRYFHFTVLPLGFLVHLLFSQSFLNLWEPIWGDKEFQSLCFPMTELERVNRWIPLRLTVRLFVRVFHAVASKLIKKSPIRWARENFLGLAVILTIKRGSFPQVEWEWKNYSLTLRLALFDMRQRPSM